MCVKASLCARASAVACVYNRVLVSVLHHAGCLARARANPRPRRPSPGPPPPQAPTAHTVLEIVKARWGVTAHIVFMVFCFLTNIIVSER